MNAIIRGSGIVLLVAGLMAAYAPTAAAAQDYKAKLSGAGEVPPVETNASGTAKIVVKKDGSVSGKVETKGIEAIAAHIHEGAAGVNGGVAIPLNKHGNDEWVVPAGSKFTEAQMAELKAGTLYVNVHSDAHKGGEIRGQLGKAK